MLKKKPRRIWVRIPVVHKKEVQWANDWIYAALMNARISAFVLSVQALYMKSRHCDIGSFLPVLNKPCMICLITLVVLNACMLKGALCSTVHCCPAWQLLLELLCLYDVYHEPDLVHTHRRYVVGVVITTDYAANDQTICRTRAMQHWGLAANYRLCHYQQRKFYIGYIAVQCHMDYHVD